ncbi:hypothetical protein FA95DRAFT_747661 [Auriscalpium vulgare]|uniref:Uncharacterized protein n=1 Tax=Auriscalpium vulgare TaxID=40419 RepID=A0ACB8SC07_9AGAM|nr:hypothetical protein FA95DRAFT_747661 [Auriscalpium vulgare]
MVMVWLGVGCPVRQRCAAEKAANSASCALSRVSLWRAGQPGLHNRHSASVPSCRLRFREASGATLGHGGVNRQGHGCWLRVAQSFSLDMLIFSSRDPSQPLAKFVRLWFRHPQRHITLRACRIIAAILKAGILTEGPSWLRCVGVGPLQHGRKAPRRDTGWARKRETENINIEVSGRSPRADPRQ